MTKQEATRESILHWEGMIDWVRTQQPNSNSEPYKMEHAIGTNWYSRHCALCNYCQDIADENPEIDEYCSICPLGEKFGKCSGANIMNAWRTVNTANTWEQWLEGAEVLLMQLKSF